MATRRCFAALYLCALFAIAVTGAVLRSRRSSSPTVTTTRLNTPARTAQTIPAPPRLVASAMARIPLSFEEARRSAETGSYFVSRGPGYALSVGRDGAVLARRAKVRVAGGDFLSSIAAMRGSEQLVSSETRLTWLGANPNARAEGVDRQRGTSNYILGNDPRKWRTNVPRFGRVRFASLYHGIDLVYHGNQDRVEMDYVVAPHTAPSAIRIGIGGPSLVAVDDQGNLSISAAGDEVLLRAPVAYQEIEGEKRIVDARYVMEGSHVVGFSIGAYDAARPLIIDPVLDYAASFGGGDDIISDVVTDANGNVYVTGTTCSVSYPVTGGALQESGGSATAIPCNDVIVTKLDPAASSLIYSTYIGGSSVDLAIRMLVDSSGDVLLGGTTASTDFPTTSGSYKPPAKQGLCSYGPFMGNQACAYGFLLKLNPTGSQLLFSTLLGGERLDFITALAENATTGNIYVAGGTNSTRFPIASPTTAVQPAYGGDNGQCELLNGVNAPCMDAFVAELDPTGSTLINSTYLGGNDDDGALAIALDTNGNVYVTGGAESATFPTTTGAYQTTHHTPVEQSDVFVTELNSSLSKPLIYSTFIGGSNPEFGTRIRVDSTGAAYVSGSTSSSDFPVFPTPTGTVQETYAGPSTMNCPEILDEAAHEQLFCGDAFVAKVAPGGASLVFSTYLGGSQDDGALNMALDSSDNVWIIGTTHSTDFPLSSPYYSSVSIGQAFLSEISADGTQNLFSTLLPGQQGLALNIDAANNVFVAGEYQTTSSLNGALATPGTYSNGQGGIFLMEFSPGTARPGVQLSATSLAFGLQGSSGTPVPVNSTSEPQSVTLTNNGTATLHLAISFSASLTSAFSESDNCGTTLAAAASCTITAVFHPYDLSSGNSAAIVIQDDAPNGPHLISLSGNTGVGEGSSFVPATLTFNGVLPSTNPNAKQTAFLTTSFSTGFQSLGAFITGPATITGPNTADFTVDTSLCAPNTNSCSVAATFAPAPGATGTRTATVSVPTNAPNSPQTLSLVGTVLNTPLAVFSTPSVTPTPVGQTLNTSFVVTNAGGLALNVTGVNASGANPGDFVVSNTTCTGYPAFTLAPQAVCLLNLAFTPGAHGQRTATFTLVDNETSPASLSVSGFGADSNGPELSLILTPSPVNGQMLFPDTVVGRTAAFNAALIGVDNFGPAGSGANLHITNATLTGNFVFDPSSNCPAATTGIGSGCTFAVDFSPKQQGLRTGTLAVTTDAPGGFSFTINFAGNGVLIPNATVSPSNINFGPQAQSTTSGAQLATITNIGNGVLNLSNASVTGPFTDTTTCGATVAPSSSCTYSFKFAPQSTGAAGGTFTVTTNAAGGGVAVGLSGVGVSGALLAAQPSTLSFLGQEIGTISAARSVTLENVGSSPATISAIHTTKNFQQVNNCLTSLAPQDSCVINVTYAPTADNFAGFTVNGTVLIDNGGPGSPLAIPITATSLASTAAATTTTVVSSANPSTVGQSVTFTATVSSTTAGMFNGNLTIYDGATQLVQQVLSNGQTTATYQTSNLSSGPHLIHATFNGDPTFNSSVSNFLTQIENTPGKSATSTAVMSSGSPSNAGQSVTFTATVTPASGTTAATGSVAFTDGGVALGSGVLDSTGKATLSTSTLASGNHNIFASYAGDMNYNGSGSTAVSQVVNATTKTNTSTTLVSAPNPSNSGQSVTFTVTVTPTSGTAIPQGSLSFTDGSNALGLPMNLDASGKATLITSLLTAGGHAITATYAGDTTFNGSVSNTVTQVVNAATKTGTTTALISSLNPSGAAQSVTFTATVTPASGSTVPTGNVSFSDGATSLGSPVALDNKGKATLATAVLAVGNHNVTASYGGDLSFNSSASSSVAQVVGDFSVSVQQSSLTVPAGQTGTLNVTITPVNGFNQIVGIGCSGLPVNSSCGPASVTLDGVHPASTTVSIITKSNASVPGSPHRPAMPTARLFSTLEIAALAALGLLIAVSSRRQRIRIGLTCGVVFFAVALLSCSSSGNSGGGSPTGTPTGTYPVTVTGAAGADVHNAPNTVTLTVN